MQSGSVVLDFIILFFLPLQFISITYVRGYFYFKRAKEEDGESLRQVQRLNNQSISASLTLPPASRLPTLITLIMRINTSAVWPQLHTNAKRERGTDVGVEEGLCFSKWKKLDDSDMKNHFNPILTI